MMNSKAQKLLSKLYYDIKSNSSFSGAANLWKEVKCRLPSIRKKDFQLWLQSQRTYTLHKPIRKKFKRNRIFVESIDEQWHADLVDVQKFEKYNDKHKYLVTIIDVFSKYAWVVPIIEESGNEIVKAFKKVFERRTPALLHTDKGNEFYNAKFPSFLKEHLVKHFSTQNSEIKCAVV